MQPNREFSDLGLPLQYHRRLERAGIHTVADLCAKTEGEIYVLRGVGVGCLRAVRQALASKGLSLADEPSPEVTSLPLAPEGVMITFSTQVAVDFFDLACKVWQADTIHIKRKNLYGGLKAVERQLRIDRKLKGVSGYDAIWLWWRYQNHNDAMALKKLLEYNREDLVNLKSLRDIIG